MNKLALAVMCLALPMQGPAQTGPGVDVLPLAVGARWDYKFYRSYYVSGWGGETDTGLVRYAVAGREVSGNATIWNLTRVRSYMHTSYSKYGAQMVSYPVDSMRFDLAELQDGRHELYRSLPDSLDLFSMQQTGLDSLRFYRYDDPGGTSPYERTFVSRASWEKSLSYVYSMVADTGIGSSSGAISVSWNSAHTTRYHLTRYFKPFSGPHLTYTAPVSFSAFTGVPVDTAFIVENDGGDTLHLQGVKTTNPGFTAVPTATSIPPLGQAAIVIRCQNPAGGTTNAALIVQSNSIYAPDTIPIVMRAKLARSLTLETRMVDFGIVPRSARHVDTTVAIRNTGNLPLILDSLTVTSAQFELAQYGYSFQVAWGIDRTSLDPGTAAHFSMRMYLNPRLEKESLDVRIYSGAPSSPDRIHMQFATDGATVIVGPRTIDYGDVGLGGRSDAIVWLTAVGNGGVSVKRDGPAATAFSCLHPISLVDFYQTVADTIRYSPTTVSHFEGFVVYASHGTYGLDTMIARDTVWLRGSVPGTDSVSPQPELPTEYRLEQNYPNPFNPSTVITCRVPVPGEVRLAVFDMLGREVTRLHDGMLGAGTFDFRFDGAHHASGSYFCRMQAGEFVKVMRMVLVR
jgi:hypothetical protein